MELHEQGAPPAADARWSGVGLGLVAALWAYNGFQDMVSVAGEVRDPARVLPRALIAGLLEHAGRHGTHAAGCAGLLVLEADGAPIRS